MIPPLERFASNPIVHPSQISFTKASGTFNPGAVIDHATGRVVLLVRVFDRDTRKSSLVLALSSDGEKIDDLMDHPAVSPAESYEELGVEDARITWIEEDELYAITYTGYSPIGPRVCLITTRDILSPGKYQRHGVVVAGENKDCVIFPEKIGGQFVILHRPPPRIECIRVKSLDDEWPEHGVPIIGPMPHTWRSARVGAGPPPSKTRIGWLLAFHGATWVEEGNVYSMGWSVLDAENPENVLYVSREAVLIPEKLYEIEPGLIPQVDPANFPGGVRVVFPEGMVERGDDLIVYYGGADVCIAGARVNKRELVDSLEKAIMNGEGAKAL
ncbi:MAG: hypothetical protein ABR582_06925 [Gemmatimonadaceae bacterium]